jgi:hypothetical protein
VSVKICRASATQKKQRQWQQTQQSTAEQHIHLPCIYAIVVIVEFTSQRS